MTDKPHIKRSDLQLDIDYAAPETPEQRAVVGLFETVFEVDGVGLDDDFFDLGGDSLHAEALSTGMAKLSGRDFQISQIGDTATPRRLASFLTATDTVAGDGKPYVFILHGKGGYTLPPREFFAGMVDRFRIHLLEVPSLRTEGPEYDTIGALAEHYLDMIDEVQPEGPVRLASFCAGGIIGLDMVARIGARGRAVESLAMYDPRLPDIVEKAMAGDGFATWVCGSDALRRLKVKWFTFRKQRQRRKGADGMSSFRISPRAKLLAAYSHHIPRPVQLDRPPLLIRSRRPLSAAWDQLLPVREEEFIDSHHSNALMRQPEAFAALMKRYFSGEDAVLERDTGTG